METESRSKHVIHLRPPAVPIRAAAKSKIVGQVKSARAIMKHTIAHVRADVVEALQPEGEARGAPNWQAGKWMLNKAADKLW